MEKFISLKNEKTKDKSLQIDIWILKCIIKYIKDKRNLVDIGKHVYLKIEYV